MHTPTDCSLRYLFPTPQRKSHTTSVIKSWMQIFFHHAFAPQLIFANKVSGSTSQVLKEIMETYDIHINDATLRHVQTRGMLDCSQQKLMHTIEVSIDCDWSHYDKYFTLTVVAINST